MNLTSANTTIMMNRGGEIPDSVPNDLIIEIFSRLPGKSVARFRSLSKLWACELRRPDFTELFLTRSWARPRLLFALEQDGDWSFFSSPQLQNTYGGKSSLVVSADFHIKFPNANFRGLTSGLIYFSSVEISKKKGWDVVGPVIFNPITRQYAILPKLRWYRRSCTFLGFDPIDKQFKVLSVAENDHRILTLETGVMSWRNIQCPFTHDPCSKNLCIDGVLYYLARMSYVIDELSYVIVCFDVRFEKFKFIEAEKSFIDYKLINYKGKLGRIRWKYDGDGNTLELSVLVLKDVEKQEWSKYVYTLPVNKLFDLRYVSVDGVTAMGEIVLSMYYTSKYLPFRVFYFNPERNTVQHDEIISFGEYYDENWHRVYVSLDYVEDLNVNDAKYLKSSQCLNIIRKREQLPMHV